MFGGEILRLIADHPTLATQKEIRPICLMKGELSQLLFFYIQLKDEKLPKMVIERITRKFIGGISENNGIQDVETWDKIMRELSITTLEAN